MIRILTTAGVVAGIYFAVAILFLGATTPDYDPMAQFVSELGATGRPGAWRLNWATLLPVSILIVLSGAGRFTSGERVSGVALVLTGGGYLLAVMNRCDLNCSFENLSREAMVHNQAAFLAFLMGLAATATVAVGSTFSGVWRRAAAAWSACALMGGGLFLLMTLGLEHPRIGGAQRLYLLAFSLWLTVDSLLIRRLPVDRS